MSVALIGAIAIFFNFFWGAAQDRKKLRFNPINKVDINFLLRKKTDRENYRLVQTEEDREVKK